MTIHVIRQAARENRRLDSWKEIAVFFDRSFQRHDVAFLAIRVREALVSLHGDPPFQQLVGQAGLPPLL